MRYQWWQDDSKPGVRQSLEK